MTSDREALLIALTKRLANDGKLIEAGWVTLQLIAIPPDASETQLSEMRMAYMAGARHLFSSIMSILDPGGEPSAADLKRMELIHTELNAFRQEMALRVGLKRWTRRGRFR